MHHSVAPTDGRARARANRRGPPTLARRSARRQYLSNEEASSCTRTRWQIQSHLPAAITLSPRLTPTHVSRLLENMMMMLLPVRTPRALRLPEGKTQTSSCLIQTASEREIAAIELEWRQAVIETNTEALWMTTMSTLWSVWQAQFGEFWFSLQVYKFYSWKWKILLETLYTLHLI